MFSPGFKTRMKCRSYRVKMRMRSARARREAYVTICRERNRMAAAEAIPPSLSSGSTAKPIETPAANFTYIPEDLSFYSKFDAMQAAANKLDQMLGTATNFEDVLKIIRTERKTLHGEPYQPIAIPPGDAKRLLQRHGLLDDPPPNVLPTIEEHEPVAPPPEAPTRTIEEQKNAEALKILSEDAPAGVEHMMRAAGGSYYEMRCMYG